MGQRKTGKISAVRYLDTLQAVGTVIEGEAERSMVLPGNRRRGTGSNGHSGTRKSIMGSRD